METSGRQTSASTPKQTEAKSIRDTKVIIEKSPDSRLLKYALTFVTLGFLIMLGAFVGSVLFTLRVMRDQKGGRLGKVGEGGGKPGESQLTDIQAINELPLSHIDKTESLYLQWGDPGTQEEKQYFFTIEAASRSPFDQKTLLMLSGHYQLFVTETKATLYDGDNKLAGVVDFEKRKQLVLEGEKQAAEDEGEAESRALYPKNKYLLKGKALLQRYGRYPTNVKRGAPTSAFDAYCRYGCGEMAVRFPYYYRPFFGYGFPLVGTESQFPQGYGGYAMAPVMMQQGLADQQALMGGGVQMQSPIMMPPMTRPGG